MDMKNKMNMIVALPLTAVLLAACGGEGLTPYNGPQSVIAIAQDRGRDSGPLVDGRAAIVYDPDGCQGWLIDDGLEGYSGRRFDPVSGLPVCNNLYPPGTVIGEYRTRSAGISDFVPGRVIGQGQPQYNGGGQQQNYTNTVPQNGTGYGQ